MTLLTNKTMKLRADFQTWRVLDSCWCTTHTYQRCKVLIKS